jgi:hypothetical protein
MMLSGDETCDWDKRMMASKPVGALSLPPNEKGLSEMHTTFGGRHWIKYGHQNALGKEGPGRSLEGDGWTPEPSSKIPTRDHTRRTNQGASGILSGHSPCLRLQGERGLPTSCCHAHMARSKSHPQHYSEWDKGKSGVVHNHTFWPASHCPAVTIYILRGGWRPHLRDQVSSALALRS